MYITNRDKTLREIARADLELELPRRDYSLYTDRQLRQIKDKRVEGQDQHIRAQMKSMRMRRGL